MVEPRHLRNAPITEAIIDFRVKPRAEFTAAEFHSAKAELVTEFPTASEHRGYSFRVDSSKPDVSALRDLGLQGLFFQSPDKKMVAQFRVDGFALNRLAPYTSWASLLPVAMRLWRLYSEIAQSEAVIRLALRYLNRIALPAAMTNFERYLTAAPMIPVALPQSVSQFVSRVTIHDADEIAAHVGQVLEADASAKRVSIILDIDAYKETHFRPSDPEIEATLQRLRDFKNRICFNYLSDETVRMFE
jgi:uncharacterized protein (TIGR04255 family)